MLATHTILMAGELNPTYVSGLDLVACTSEGFRAISGTELDSLIGKSKTLDSAIKASFRTQARFLVVRGRAAHIVQETAPSCHS